MRYLPKGEKKKVLRSVKLVQCETDEKWERHPITNLADPWVTGFTSFQRTPFSNTKSHGITEPGATECMSIKVHFHSTSVAFRMEHLHCKLLVGNVKFHDT